MKDRTPTRFTLIALCLFIAGIAPMVQAKTCSNALAAGAYGFSISGTLVLPTGPVAVIAVGRLTEDAAGHVSGTQIESRGGMILGQKLVGTFSTNPDCTGTITAETFTNSGAPAGAITISTVLVDNGRKLRGVVTSPAVTPNGTFPLIIGAEADKLFSESDNQQ